MKKVYALLLVLTLVLSVVGLSSCGSVVDREVNLGDIPAPPPKPKEVIKKETPKPIEKPIEKEVEKPIEKPIKNVVSKDTPYFSSVTGAERMGDVTKLNWIHAGKNQDLSNFGGKVYLVDVWAEWCGPCKMSTPALVDLHNRYADKGLVVIGVNIDPESKIKTARNYADDVQIPYPILTDPQGGLVGGKFVQGGIPNFTIVDSKGKILKEHTGAIQKGSPGLADIERVIKQALGQ